MDAHTLDILLWVVGILLVIFIAYSGYQYHKDCKAYEKKKNKDIT